MKNFIDKYFPLFIGFAVGLPVSIVAYYILNEDGREIFWLLLLFPVTSIIFLQILYSQKIK